MYCELHSRVFISVIGTCFFPLMNRSLWYILMYNIVLIEQKFLCSVRRDNRILYLFFKWSFLVNTALWVYSTNQIMTVIQNHSCKMETVDPVLEVACSAKVSCICAVKTTTRWTSAHLVCSLVLSLSFSFTHTNTNTHTPASSCSDPLGGLGWGLVNFRWTHYGNDFPLAPMLFQTANAYCLKERLPSLDR